MMTNDRQKTAANALLELNKTLNEMSYDDVIS